jgi:hypothetical protein
MDAQVKDTVPEKWRRAAVADVFSVARELPVGWSIDATVDPGKIMAGVGGNFDGTADMCLHAIKFMGPRGRMGLARDLAPVGRRPFAIAFRLATCFHPVKAMLDGVYSGRPPGFRALVRDASGAEQVCVEAAGRDGELRLNGQRTGVALPMLTWCSFCLAFDPIRQQATLYVEDGAVGHGTPPLPRLSECTAPLREPKTRPAEIAFMLPDDEEGYAALWLDAFAVYEGDDPVMPVVAASRRPAGEPLPLSENRLSPLPAGSVRATGAIGARLDLAVRKNMMALDIDGDFLGPYGTAGRRGVEDREALEQGLFVGAGNLLDAVTRMAFYSGDQAVQAAAARLVERLSGLQSSNGYIGLYPETPERCPLFTEFCLHDAVYLVLGLAADYRLHGRATSLAAARKQAAYIVANWARRPTAPVFTPLGINEAFMELYRAAPDPALLQFLKQERCGKQWTIQNASLLDWDQAVWTGGHGDRNKSQNGEAAERHAIVHVYRLFERCMAQLALCELQSDDRLTVMPRRIAARLLDRERTGLLITGAAGNGEGWEDTQRCAGQIGETCAASRPGAPAAPPAPRPTWTCCCTSFPSRPAKKSISSCRIPPSRGTTSYFADRSRTTPLRGARHSRRARLITDY